MKILLTGATGYIGQRLLPQLLENGHDVICCVRDKSRFYFDNFTSSRLTVAQVDFLDCKSLNNLPNDIDAAYYLVHSMSSTTGDFSSLETTSAENFKAWLDQTTAKQVIYLSGI